jgi:Domain of unknown function (DUF1707)
LPDERPEGAAVRASDEDRERVVAALKEHCAAGRLTLEELPGRVERAYAAATVADLSELTRDLPRAARPGGAPAAPAATGRRPWVPGILPFSETIEFDRPLAKVETEALRLIAPRLARAGFNLAVSDSRNMLFLRTGRLLRTHRVQLTLTPLSDDRTHLMIHGTAPLGIRRAFAELRD